jgi:hypothetical protein
MRGIQETALGYCDLGRSTEEEAVAEARRLETLLPPGSEDISSQLFNLCLAAQLRRETQRLLQRIEVLDNYARQNGILLRLTAASMLRGWASARIGDPGQGLQHLQRGVLEFKRSGFRHLESWFIGLLAEVLGWARRAEEGLSTLDQLTDIQGTASAWFDIELERIRGELLVQTGDTARSEVCFTSAIRLARERSVRLFELRSATSLARLWRDQGKRTEAYEFLAPVYGWFTEGFDLPDLVEARQLLSELE